VNPTSLSLLDRLKLARPEASDWSRLQRIYLPLIERWLSRVPGLRDESADVAQEVLVVVFREVPRFTRQREGSFRAWLRPVTVNKVRDYRRKRQRRPAAGIGFVRGQPPVKLRRLAVGGESHWTLIKSVNAS
jgi:RNA polymerase sigma-70 factor, ECF subfamily